MLRSFFTFSLIFATFIVHGQYFQYSQYNFTSQRINPAMVAASNYSTVGLIYRNQTAGGDLSLKSSMVSASYPLLSRKTGMRWSGVGVSLMDDRAGGIFSTQEASLSYAINIIPARFQSLSLGFKGLYQARKINLDGLFTGSQYIPDRGFDQSLFSGENIQFLRSDFFTFSTGVYWEQTDRQENKLAYWGISIFDFNKPQDSFSEVKSELNSTLIFMGGVRIYEHKEISIMPELLFTRSSSNNVFNIGTVTSYSLKTLPNKRADRIDLITKYVIGRSGILGLQLHRENFSIGVSYDFPVVKRNAGNFNAFEVALQLRRLVDPRLRKRIIAKKKSTPPLTASKQAIVKKTPVKNNVVNNSNGSSDSLLRSAKAHQDLKTTLLHKQDSAIATAEAGDIHHQPLVIEKITLHFNFEFNSSDLDEESMQYLDDLTIALKENEHLRIKLTGHTDNVGSAKFNQRLSLYRANAIKEYLIEKGVNSARILTDGKGLAEPLNENKTDEEKAKNRRVELVILYEN